MLEKAEKAFAKYGVFAIFIGRFLTLIRSIIPLKTGVGDMVRAKYTAFDFISFASWTGYLGVLVVGIENFWNF